MTVSEMADAGLDSSVVAAAGMSMSDLPHVSEVVREHSLRVDLTIHGALPSDDADKAKPIDEWTDADYDLVDRNRDTIVAAFA